MEIIISFLICLLATTAGGISGVGGGVIIKPFLDAFSELPVSTISFLSGCTVLAMTASSVINNRKSKIRIELRRGTLLAIGGAIGGILGKNIFDIVCMTGDAIIGMIQQLLMIILTLGVLWYTLKKNNINTHDIKNPIVCWGIGLLLGILSSFLGIGGGPINLAVLSYFFSMDSKTAALHSLYIILFSQSTSFLNTLINHKVPEYDWRMLFVMVVGGILGGTLGRKISRNMDNKDIDRLFFWLLLLITGISVYNLWKLI